MLKGGFCKIISLCGVSSTTASTHLYALMAFSKMAVAAATSLYSLTFTHLFGSRVLYVSKKFLILSNVICGRSARD